MADSFRIDVIDQGVQAELGRLVAASGNLTPAMRAISMALLSRTDANFAAESGPDGPWPALKEATIKRRGGDAKKLQDKGRLAASVQPFSAADEAGIGSNAVYAAIHQLGGIIEKAAQSRLVRHRTDAKGELLRSGALGGKGLVFAKDSHKRAIGRWFEQGAHAVGIPARAYMPVGKDGQLQAGVDVDLLEIIQGHLLGRSGITV